MFDFQPADLVYFWRSLVLSWTWVGSSPWIVAPKCASYWCVVYICHANLDHSQYYICKLCLRKAQRIHFNWIPGNLNDLLVVVICIPKLHHLLKISCQLWLVCFLGSLCFAFIFSSTTVPSTYRWFALTVRSDIIIPSSISYPITSNALALLFFSNNLHASGVLSFLLLTQFTGFNGRCELL